MGTALATEDVTAFEDLRPRLEAIAYRLLGSAAEAEDVVQETFLRWQAADRDAVRVPAAWLTRVLTNLCLTHLGSARARREVYVGHWLPEPLLGGDPMLGPADTVEQRESVSTAILALMERLTPLERAVYVLREAFDVPHAEIADMLGLSEAASQQHLHRARTHLAAERARTAVDQDAAREVVEEFLSAATTGRTEPLLRLLAEDAMGAGDGGGYVPARGKPFHGAMAVAKFLRGLFRPTGAKRSLLGADPTMYAWTANGSPALVVEVDGRLFGIMVLEQTEEGIAAVLSQVNPEKLGRAARQWAASDHGPALPSPW